MFLCNYEEEFQHLSQTLNKFVEVLFAMASSKLKINRRTVHGQSGEEMNDNTYFVFSA